MTERNDNRIFGDLNPEKKPEPADVSLESYEPENPIAPEHDEPAKSRVEKLKELSARLRIDSFSAAQRAKDAITVWNARRKDDKLMAQQLKSEVAAAQKEALHAKAEFIGTDIEKFAAELEALEDAQIESMDTKTPEILKRAYNGYKKLGEITLLGKNKLRLNARTATSMGLLGVGITTAAFAPAVAPLAIAAKRGFSGASTTFATYDLAMMGWDKWHRGDAEKQLEAAVGPAQIRELMIKMRIRSGMDGKNLSDLKKDDLYVKLSARFKELIGKETEQIGMPGEIEQNIERLENAAHAAGKTAELKDNPEYQYWKQEDAKWREREISRYFTESMENVGGIIKKEARNEKIKRAATAVGAAGVGTFVGGGWMAEIAGDKIDWLKNKFGLSGNIAPTPPEVDIEAGSTPSAPMASGGAELIQPEIKTSLSQETLASIQHPEMPAGRTLDDLASKTIPFPKEAELDISKTPELGPEAVVHAGSRGLEGALLDLKKSNPDRYAKMIEWLKGQEYNQGVTNDGALIHRYMLDYAENHGMSVDGGGNDLSRILSGEINIKADGSLSMERENIDFMAEKVAEDTAPAVESEASPQESLEQLSKQPIPEITRDITESSDIHLPDNIEAAPTPAEIESAKLAEAHEIAADSTERASDAVQLVLGDESKHFLKETFKLSPTNLNRVAKKSITEFLAAYENGNPRFKKDYAGLFASISEQIKATGSKTTIRQFVLAAANNFKETR